MFIERRTRVERNYYCRYEESEAACMTLKNDCLEQLHADLVRIFDNREISLFF